MLNIGEKKFIPQPDRLEIFACCLPLQPNETVTYNLSANRILEIQALEIDPRYGKVALVIAVR